MLKILVTVVTLLLSIAIIAFGVSMTVESSDFDAIKYDYAVALQTPILPPQRPEAPDTPTGPETPVDPENPDNPGEEITPPEEEDGGLGIFGDLFDTYNPDFADINKQVLSNAVSNVIPEDQSEVGGTLDTVINTYIDNLYGEIDKIHTDTEGATEEEKAAAKEEFAQKEMDAFNGLTEIVTHTTAGHTPDEETVVDSVAAVLDSTVCLETVVQVSTEDPESTERIQQATENLTPETKQEIEDLINNAYSDPENEGKEDYYKAVADLFGITLNK